LISVELLAQIAHSGNVGYNMNPSTVWEKVYSAAKLVHTVNINKYASLTDPIVQDTAMVAYGIYMDGCNRRKSVFQSAQRFLRP
jgi:hypothetical protein